ncbi:MAG: DUF2232 domain-containing protein, partial [Ktedonobacterales bacterium]
MGSDVHIPIPAYEAGRGPEGPAHGEDGLKPEGGEALDAEAFASPRVRRPFKAAKARARGAHGPALDAIGLAEGGLLADVGIVLDLATIYIPIIGTVLAPAVPTPFAVLMLRRGPRVTLVAATVAGFLVTVLAGPHFGWRMGLEALVGMLLGWAMRRRLHWTLVLTLGTFIVATVTFGAAIGVIFVTGLPVKDIVGELRNGMASVAWAVAAGASLIGGQAQWLAVRPALVSVGLVALRFWPVLLYLYVVAAAAPAVALYFAVANASARVMGHDVPLFPPRWALWLLRTGVFLALSPVLLPARLLHRLRGGDGDRGLER